jgi:hypothetical protein
MANLQLENQRLRELLWQMVKASGRMLDNWAERDNDGKKALWQELHTKGAEANEYLQSTSSVVGNR